jgi:hypothetical protein
MSSGSSILRAPGHVTIKKTRLRAFPDGGSPLAQSASFSPAPCERLYRDGVATPRRAFAFTSCVYGSARRVVRHCLRRAVLRMSPLSVSHGRAVSASSRPSFFLKTPHPAALLFRDATARGRFPFTQLFPDLLFTRFLPWPALAKVTTSWIIFLQDTRAFAAGAEHSAPPIRREFSAPGALSRR